MNARDSEKSGQYSTNHRTPRIKRLLAHPSALALILATMAILVTLPQQSSEAIISGRPVDDAPSWSVYLTGPKSHCSGSLIASNLVLTAAHCEHMTKATIGATDLGDIPHTGTDGLVRDFEAFEANPDGDDVAVYKLSSAVPYAKIEISAEDIHLNPQPATLYGYGRTRDIPKENDLLIHSVDGISVPCGSIPTAPSKFCLRSIEPHQSPCAGDSGAPIVTAFGTLGAVHRGQIHKTGSVCNAANPWTATSVTTESMRNWLASMINKYE